MRLKNIITIAATLGLAIATAAPVLAQSTRNVGNGIEGNNIGGGGGGNFSCVSVTLAGATRVRVCQSGYTASLGNIICSGYVSSRFNSYNLAQAPCNQAGQNFLGGTLSCDGRACNWTPSAAGRAQGFQPEYVSAYYN